jgi:hypothetical protein
MTAVDLVTIRLVWAEDVALRPSPHFLRGAIGGCFPDNPLFHQHDGERLLYRYPLIQYRWDQSGPWLLGLGAGAQFLKETEWIGMQLNLGGCAVTVRDAVCAFRFHEIRATGRLCRYRFAAPWLPLSQDNYARYQRLSRIERCLELDRLAVAGVLLGLRGFGVEFSERLYAAFEMKSARPCEYKGVQVMGFTGCLMANVDLPDGFAIGRAVSHGYGWITSPQKEPSSDDVRDA